MNDVHDLTRYGARGAVCTVDHHATAAGLALLKAGGTAADAAVGASAVLAVTTQHICGAGGDLLAVVGRPGGDVESLLAVGRAGSGSDADQLRAEGHRRMSFSLVVGPDSVTAVRTMGGDAQPQVVLQLLAALRSGATPATALARPRWVLTGPRQDGFDQWEPWPDGTVVPAVAVEATPTASCAQPMVGWRLPQNPAPAPATPWPGERHPCRSRCPSRNGRAA